MCFQTYCQVHLKVVFEILRNSKFRLSCQSSNSKTKFNNIQASRVYIAKLGQLLVINSVNCPRTLQWMRSQHHLRVCATQSRHLRQPLPKVIRHPYWPELSLPLRCAWYDSRISLKEAQAALRPLVSSSAGRSIVLAWRSRRLARADYGCYWHSWELIVPKLPHWHCNASSL